MAEFSSDLALILAKEKPSYFSSDHFSHNIHLIFLSYNPKLLLCILGETNYLKENKQTDALLIMSEPKYNFGATCCTEHSGCSLWLLIYTELVFLRYVLLRAPEVTSFFLSQRSAP